MPYHIHCVPILKDNYCWLIGNLNDREIYILDPGEAPPILDYLHENQLVAKGILLTHKHHDHVMGIDEIKRSLNIEVAGPAGPGYADDKIERILEGGENIQLWPEHELQVVFTPGHTQNHLCFLLDGTTAEPRLFCGDTLFSAGCGRLLGGTAQQLKNSLDWINSLAETTIIYCSHEYTEANLEFARNVEPNNMEIIKKIKETKHLRAENRPTLPTLLAIERQINPFLRCNSSEIQATIAQKSTKTAQKSTKTIINELSAFITLRLWKDDFRPFLN